VPRAPLPEPVYGHVRAGRCQTCNSYDVQDSTGDNRPVAVT